MNTYSSPVRVAVAGATGYAGQELVALLARHPHVRLEAAMSSSADSAARPLPRLARVWDGQVEPLNTERLATDDGPRVSRGARERGRRAGAAARRRRRPRHRSLGRVPHSG